MVTNTAASVATAINSGSPIVGTNYSMQFDIGTFLDPEGDTLVYFANLADGTPLPSWAFFQPTVRTFKITAPLTQVLTISV